MNKNYLVFGGGAVLLLAVILTFFFMGKTRQSAPVLSPSPEVSLSPTPIPTGSSNENSVKEFEILASNFKFSVNEIKVKKGDTVRIVLKNEEGVHDWKVDEFNAQTEKLQAGQTETIEFVADKTGVFEYYCSMGTHRQMGMKGNLIVE
ncbi:TPA: hypothetical protein DEX28_01840 [Patescibacteria group bacterium]|nr:MAG: Plastocyanin [Parcubacteria group bacterium GW2011_GWB1_45_10]HCI05465.1 hypothetical protein [Patescibacteria group bacterium]